MMMMMIAVDERLYEVSTVCRFIN